MFFKVLSLLSLLEVIPGLNFSVTLGFMVLLLSFVLCWCNIGQGWTNKVFFTSKVLVFPNHSYKVLQGFQNTQVWDHRLSQAYKGDCYPNLSSWGWCFNINVTTILTKSLLWSVPHYVVIRYPGKNGTLAPFSFKQLTKKQSIRSIKSPKSNVFGA